MGGNVTAISKTGEKTRAQKVPLKSIGRQVFMKKIQDTLLEMNKKFKEMYGFPIWKNEKIILDGSAFNGSTSFIMDPNYSDAEIVKYKPMVGDIDLAVPSNLNVYLFNFLDAYDFKEIAKGVIFKGSNRTNSDALGFQINAIFEINFNGTKVNVQIDFEFLDFKKNGNVSEWGKFSHSSDFSDTVAGVKAVAHKYLLRAVVSSFSTRSDVLIATSKSTYDNYKISNSKTSQDPKFLKFSVDRGVRTAYEPLVDLEGNQIVHDGKPVFKEISASNSTYIQDVKSIYKMIFNRSRSNSSEIKKMNSFVGLLELLQKYSDKDQLKKIHDRFISLLWGVRPQRAQELEVNNPDLDKSIKESAYNMLIKKFNLPDKSKEMKEIYYSGYSYRELNESFRSIDILNLSFSDLYEAKYGIKGWEY